MWKGGNKTQATVCTIRDNIYSLLLHCRCLRPVRLRVMVLPVMNLWLKCSMLCRRNRGLGIVQLVWVTSQMTNGPPVTCQQSHLQCRSNDKVCYNDAECIVHTLWHDRGLCRVLHLQWARRVIVGHLVLRYQPSQSANQTAKKNTKEEQLEDGWSCRLDTLFELIPC